MAKKYAKGVSAAVIATMNAMAAKGSDMDATVAKLMSNLNLPVHRARAYFRTFVKNGTAKGTIPTKTVKAKPAKTKATPVAKPAKPVPADRLAVLKAAAKKAGIAK
jgi:hypothetical protein